MAHVRAALQGAPLDRPGHPPEVRVQRLVGGLVVAAVEEQRGRGDEVEPVGDGEVAEGADDVEF